MQKPRLRISASKMRMLAECVAKLEFKYIIKIPEPDHEYFKRGRIIEEHFVKAFNEGQLILGHTDYERCAQALLNNADLMSVLKGKKIQYHNEYKIVKCCDCQKWSQLHDTRDIKNCQHCDSENMENYGLIAITDVEAEGFLPAIDIKTSSANRGDSSVTDNKRQAKMYAFVKSVVTGHDINETRFANVNVKTLSTQFIQVKIGSFDDFRSMIEEMRFYFAENVFPKNPTRKCKDCAFNAVCSKK